LSLSNGILALAFNRNEKLKKIKRFTHKRVVQAHEAQRLTWLDVCPLTRRLLQMKRWEEELSEGLTLDCLAKREGVELERVERLMNLLNLPEERVTVQVIPLDRGQTIVAS